MQDYRELKNLFTRPSTSDIYKADREARSDADIPATDSADQKRPTESDAQKRAEEPLLISEEPEREISLCSPVLEIQQCSQEPPEAHKEPLKVEAVPTQAEPEKTPQNAISTPQHVDAGLIPDESIILYWRGRGREATSILISMARRSLEAGTLAQEDFEKYIAQGKAA
ncbi:hypothetical protein ABKT97_14495 [Enterobacter hormaechei]